MLTLINRTSTKQYCNKNFNHLKKYLNQTFLLYEIIMIKNIHGLIFFKEY